MIKFLIHLPNVVALFLIGFGIYCIGFSIYCLFSIIPWSEIMSWLKMVGPFLLEFGILLFEFGILLFLFLIRFTTIEEGTAKIVMRFGGVVKVFIQWVGYKLDENGDVVVSAKTIRPWYGGLRFWIGTPFDKINKYKLRYHTVEEREGKRVPVFHEEEEKEYVLLRPDRYWRRSSKVETRDGQFPDVEWLIGMRSVNPEKTIFKSPHNWVENALNQLEPTLRTFVQTKDLKDLLGFSRKQIWDEIIEDNKEVIETVLAKEWGIQIDKEEIGIFDVGMPAGYQEALAAKSRQEMEAAGRAEDIVGTLIAAVARFEKKEVDDIKKKFIEDPEEFYRRHKPLIDNIMTKLSIEKDLYFRVEALGSDGFEGTLLKLIAAWQRMPKGGGKEQTSTGGKEGEKGGKKKKKRPKSIPAPWNPNRQLPLPKPIGKEKEEEEEEEPEEEPEETT